VLSNLDCTPGKKKANQESGAIRAPLPLLEPDAENRTIRIGVSLFPCMPAVFKALRSSHTTEGFAARRRSGYIRAP
jgi:hypothetical protein